jgi:hypothetical protein
MKKIKYYLYTVVCLAFFLTSCEDIMNKQDLDNVGAENVWQDPKLIQAFLDNIMRGENNTGITEWERGLLHHTEENYGYSNREQVNDLLTADADDGGRWWNNVDRWGYTPIRNINKFLGNIDKAPIDKLPANTKADLIAQAKVLRAHLYFEMTRVYGGVPLIDHEQQLSEGDALYVKRSKTSECIQFVIDDLDAAINTSAFPMKRSGADASRITKAVAYAYKGKVLLTYASPQFTKETPAGTKDATTRWNEAYTACKAAKDALDAAGYGLFRPNPATPAEATQNFYDMYRIKIPENPEMVWVRSYLAGVATNPWDKEVRPISSYGNERYGPTLEFVCKFPNADGTPYTGITIPTGTAGQNVAQTESTAPYWIGRDPRFYAVIAYNGCNWPLFRRNSYAGDENANKQMIHQWMWSGAADPYENMDANGYNPGFRIRKMVDQSLNFASSSTQCSTDWPNIRYTEVLMNYAEASAMTGHETDAVNALKAIRKRAGIPEGSSNYGLGNLTDKYAIVAAILREKLIELCYEGGHRFYDLRRWRLYTDKLGASTEYPLNGMARHTIKAVIKGEKDDAVLAATHIDTNPDAYFALFKDEIRSMDVVPFCFSERQYFLRIPYLSHIKTNPILEQTRGWTDERGDGTFNPYE